MWMFLLFNFIKTIPSETNQGRCCVFLGKQACVCKSKCTLTPLGLEVCPVCIEIASDRQPCPRCYLLCALSLPGIGSWFSFEAVQKMDK